MNEKIGKCDVMLLFCSPNAAISEPVNDEWTAFKGLNCAEIKT